MKLLAAILITACSSVMAMSLSDLAPGKTVHGPNLSTADMKNKVVLVLYWGTH